LSNAANLAAIPSKDFCCERTVARRSEIPEPKKEALATERLACGLVARCCECEKESSKSELREQFSTLLCSCDGLVIELIMLPDAECGWKVLRRIDMGGGGPRPRG